MALLPWVLGLTLFFLLLESKGKVSFPAAIRTVIHASYFTLNSCILMVILPFFFVASFGSGTVGISRFSLFFQFIIVVLVLDLCSFLLHVLSHHLPFLYFFHQVHHSDDRVDASTALRMHLVQMTYSLGPDIALILAFKPSIEAYLLYAGVTQFCVLFHHSKVSVPNVIGNIFVTPETHLEHHKETVNFGSIFSFWDLLFGTLCKRSSSEPLGLPTVHSPFSYRELFLPPWRMPLW